MTLKELRDHVERLPRELDALEVKAWLPGSTIRLDAMQVRHDGVLLVLEGNVDPGQWNAMGD